jgi:spermidine synthase
MLNLVFILIGFTSIVAQTMLLRELVMAFAGNELSLGIFFASWLISLALGSRVFSIFYAKKDSLSGFVPSWLVLLFVLQIAALFILPLQIFIIKGARLILHVNPGEIIPPFPVFYFPFLSLISFGFIQGFLFALSCRIYSEIEPDTARAIGKVYLYDAIGGMLGGLAFSYFFIAFFHPFRTWAILLAANLSVFLVLSVRSGFRRFSACIIIILCFLAINVFNGNLDRFNSASLRLGWKGFNLSEVKSSRYGDFAVVKDAGLSSIYENGELLFTNPNRLHSEEIVHLPMLEISNPGNILILGDAISGPLAEILKYSPQRVDCVEPDRVLVDLSSRHITGEDSLALASPVVKIHNLDGRAFVKDYKENSFDCIIVNTGRPATAVANRFYTLEFFREAAKILKDSGVISLGIDSNENYLGPELRNFNGCVYNTIKKIFPYVVLVPGETLYIIASRSPSFITSDPFLLAQRLKSRRIKTQFLNKYTLAQYFLPGRIAYVRSVIEGTDKKRLNLDFRPVSYYFNLTLWGAKFRSNIAAVFWGISSMKFWWFFTGIAVLTAVFILNNLRENKKRKRSFVFPLAVVNTGFAGISLEIILIIGFQVLYGYLYHLVGIIIASFMLGLVAGIACITPGLAGIQDKPAALAKWQLWLGIYSLFLAGILYFLSFHSGGMAARVNVRILFPLLTLIDGFFVGTVFPLASSGYADLTDKNAGDAGGILYAFDLAGACIGSLLISIFLVPLYGVISALVLVASISFATTAVLKAESRKLRKI